MNSAFYDVVVLGRRLGALLAGALLAKRGFRVLFLGQDDVAPSYRAAGIEMPRAPFAFLPAQTPVVRRVLSELALHQLVRRHLTHADPSMQVCLPNHRFDLALEPAAMEREVEREFPEVKRPVEDLHRSISRASDAFDRMTERDLVWPPEGFFERREFARAQAGHPFGTRGAEQWDPLSDLAEDHVVRQVLQVPARFASGLDPNQLAGLGIVRPYAGWLTGLTRIDGGYSWLEQTIVEKVTTYSGEVRFKERADRIRVSRGSASGVRIAGTMEEIGCNFVIAGCSVAELLRLVPDRAPFEEVFERIGEPQPRWYRFTVNFVVDADAIPVGMARDVFWVRDPERARAAENLFHVEVHPADAENRRLLCVQTLLPRRGIEEVHGYLEGARERVHAALRELVPFLDEHLLFIDSPHDGRDVMDVRHRRTLSPDEPWTRGPATMEAIHGYPVRGALGVCAMPSSTPFRRLFLCNDQVVPGLGVEGLFLASASVARLVTRADRRKEWMRRGLFTKIEL